MSGTSPRRPRPPEAGRPGRPLPPARTARGVAPGRAPGGAAAAVPPADRSLPDDLVAVGRVADAYGVHGWIKVEPYNDPRVSVLRTSRRWWLAQGAPLGVESARVHGATIVAKPEGCDDREAALALKGLEIRVRRADFPRSDEGEYYWVDLLGCRVTNPAGDDLGTVSAVEEFGAHPVLVTEAAPGVRRLIPFVAAHVVSVDLAARAIVADWPAEA